MGVLLRVPDSRPRLPHFLMGLTLTLTHRPSQGIAEYERALALDSNFAAARAHIGVTKHRLGCAEETEANVQAVSVSALATRTPTLGSHTLRPHSLVVSLIGIGGHHVDRRCDGPLFSGHGVIPVRAVIRSRCRGGAR